jgi:hypothetical protein
VLSPALGTHRFAPSNAGSRGLMPTLTVCRTAPR